ncbi:hypothetical protein KSD_16620 [Ktedonobacter sp. SOSP1-85]|nr:hypothetical protein KSD_16620 [Ktedonobacter sp. SOSP1-85]
MELFEQFVEEAFGSFCVAATLHKDVKHISVLIHRSPQILSLTTDRKKHLVQMPLVTTTRMTMSQCIGVRLPKFQAPLTYRFIGDDDPALGEKFLDITRN